MKKKVSNYFSLRTKAQIKDDDNWGVWEGALGRWSAGVGEEEEEEQEKEGGGGGMGRLRGGNHGQ